jgi:hypothetical protein
MAHQLMWRAEPRLQVRRSGGMTMIRRFVLGASLALAMILAGSVSSSAVDGRWKLADDGSCYFDAEDSGPDQCDATPGRWKDDGNGGCYFDENDSGPDQCVGGSAASGQH